MPVIKRLLCTFLVAAALCSILVSCSETELIEGDNLLPDMSTDDFRDESGVVQWPTEILPEDFPVPDYDEIYAVERNDNIVSVTVFSVYDIHDINDLKIPDSYYSIVLSDCGYFMYESIGYNPDDGGYFYNKSNKAKVILYSTEQYPGTHLESVNQKSTTGFTMQIIVSRTILQPESFLWDYPNADTDLGLEHIKFDIWPSEHLPEKMENPALQGVDVKVIIEQKNTGMFITVSGNHVEVQRFRNLIFHSFGRIGYYNGKEWRFTYIDADGNYVYHEILSAVPSLDKQIIYLTEQFQICKFNEYIKKNG